MALPAVSTTAGTSAVSVVSATWLSTLRNYDLGHRDEQPRHGSPRHQPSECRVVPGGPWDAGRCADWVFARVPHETDTHCGVQSTSTASAPGQQGDMGRERVGIILPVNAGMKPLRPSPFRAPLLAVVIFVLALLALYPGASLRAQAAPERPATPGVDGEVVDLVRKGKQLEITYKNIGSVATDIVGELQVRDEAGNVVDAVAFVEGRRIDAGKTAKYRVNMPALPAGKYVLFALVHFGGPALAAAQADLEIQQDLRR